MSLDQDVAELFPQLKRQIRGRRMVYLDSAATALKPLTVIEAVRSSLAMETANVHRGAHLLSDEATEKFEGVREKLVDFFGAESRAEIIFTKGTTDGINLIAQSLGGLILEEGDEILVSQMEHHSNIVPWQMIALQKRVKVRFVPVTDDGSLDFEAFKAMLSRKTKIVSLIHVSNALGTINPLAKFFKQAKEVGAVCVVDAAQSASILPLHVRELGADFVAFSSHKVFGPTGVGVLYGKKQWLDKMPPYQGGGSMIAEVTEAGTTYLAPPHRFEAGTPAIAEVMGLGAALDFVRGLGYDRIRSHERDLTKLAEDGLQSLGGIRRIGTAPEHTHAISFLIGKAHPSDVGAILDEQGVAVRAGHHCCQPLMKRFQIPGTVRASFSVYTSEVDIAEFIRAVGEGPGVIVMTPTIDPKDILIRTLPTPNPYAMKFVINASFKDEGKATFNTPDEAPDLPLVRDLFAIDGVKQIHLFQNTLTVTHAGELDNDDVSAKVEAVIRTRYALHNPAFGEAQPKPKVRPENQDPILREIEEILDRTIRPGLQADGGDLEVLGFENDELKVMYQGACGGCPSSTAGTLDAIQGILRHELNNENIIVSPM